MRTLFFMALFWGSMAFFFVDPFYGIVHYSLINIIRPEQLLWGGGVGRIFLMSQAANFAAWLIKKEQLHPEDTPLPTQIKIMLVVGVGMLLSTAFATIPPEDSWIWTSQFFKTIIMFSFLMSKSINSAKKLELYYVISTSWFMLLQVWGIQQKRGGNERMEGLGGVQLGDVNDLASVAVLYFPMAYYMLYSKKRWVRLFVGIPTTLTSIMFILFGGSRGAFMGLAVCGFFIFLRTPGLQKFKMAFTSLIVGALLIGLLSVLAPPGFFDEYTARLKTMTGEESEDTGEVQREGSSAGRIAMWKAAFHLFRQHSEFWLTGMGMRGFSSLYYSYMSEIEPYLEPEEVTLIYHGGEGGKAIHNSYINLATSGGLVVIVPWFYLYFYAWFQAYRIPKKYPKIIDGVDIHNYAKATEIGLIGAALTILFINAEFVDFYYWHMTMAGIIANLGKAQLRRQALGQEDEEFDETTAAAHKSGPLPY